MTLLRDFLQHCLGPMLLLLLACAVGYAFGYLAGEENTKSTAVKCGLAEWMVHPKTGERFFLWRQIAP